MILASYLAGIAILSLLPLLFLAARLLAKRAKRQAWTVDDALLCIALVQPSQRSQAQSMLIAVPSSFSMS